MGTFSVSRRDFLLGTGAFMGGLPRSEVLPFRKRTGTRLVLLGTGGWPSSSPERGGPSQLILVDDVPYLVDCGREVAWRLVRSGIHPRRVSNIFITRQDADHAADYANLILMGWASGLAARVDTYGPPPLERMTNAFLGAIARDVPTRSGDDDWASLVRLLHAHEVRETGWILQGEGVDIAAARVDSPGGCCLAYRFNTRDRSIVISGNAVPSEDLIEFVRGADVLVHEALYPPSIERILGGAPHASGRIERALAYHAKIEDAGRLAAAGGASTLVLSRLVPGDDRAITDDMWRERASRYFRGEILVGRDLMEI